MKRVPWYLCCWWSWNDEIWVCNNDSGETKKYTVFTLLAHVSGKLWNLWFSSVTTCLAYAEHNAILQHLANQTTVYPTTVLYMYIQCSP